MGKSQKIYTPELTRSDIVVITYALEDLISEYAEDNVSMVYREKEVLAKLKDFLYNVDRG